MTEIPASVPQQPDARQRLLHSALRLFTQRGFAATSVREICEQAGVTKPVLYYYFKSKEGLYLALMQEPFADFDRVVTENRCGNLSASNGILDFARHSYRLFVENLDTARLMYAIYYGPPQGAPFFDFEAYHQKMIDTVRDLVTSGIGSGEFVCSQAEHMTWIIIGVITVAMEEQLCQREPRVNAISLVEMLNLLLQGWRTPPVPGEYI